MLTGYGSIKYTDGSSWWVHDNWYQSRPILGRFGAPKEKHENIQSDISQARSKESEISIEELKRMVRELVESKRGNIREEAAKIDVHQLFDKMSEPKIEAVMKSNSSTNPPSIPEPIRQDFPIFDSNFPRTWLRRCRRYFEIHPMSEQDKVSVASTHLDGKVRTWYSDNIEGQENVGWEAFSKMIVEMCVEDKCSVMDKINESAVVERLELNNAIVEDELLIEAVEIGGHQLFDKMAEPKPETSIEEEDEDKNYDMKNIDFNGDQDKLEVVVDIEENDFVNSEFVEESVDVKKMIVENTREFEEHKVFDKMTEPKFESGIFTNGEEGYLVVDNLSLKDKEDVVDCELFVDVSIVAKGFGGERVIDNEFMIEAVEVKGYIVFKIMEKPRSRRETPPRIWEDTGQINYLPFEKGIHFEEKDDQWLPTDGGNNSVVDGVKNIFDFFFNVGSRGERLASDRRKIFWGGPDGKFSDSEEMEVPTTISKSSVLSWLLNMEIDDHFDEDDSSSTNVYSFVSEEKSELSYVGFLESAQASLDGDCELLHSVEKLFFLFEHAMAYEGFPQMIASRYTEKVIRLKRYLKHLHYDTREEGSLGMVSSAFPITSSSEPVGELISSMGGAHKLGFEAQNLRLCVSRYVTTNCVDLTFPILESVQISTWTMLHKNLSELLSGDDTKDVKENVVAFGRILEAEEFIKGLAILNILGEIEKGTGKKIHEVSDLNSGTFISGMLFIAIGMKLVSFDKSDEIYKELEKLAEPIPKENEATCPTLRENESHLGMEISGPGPRKRHCLIGRDQWYSASSNVEVPLMSCSGSEIWTGHMKSMKKENSGTKENDWKMNQRTVFSYKIPLKATERDVFEFFLQVGKVRDVKLITNRNLKGVGYLEFHDVMSLLMAIALSGHLFPGQLIMVKPSVEEKNIVQTNIFAGGTRLPGQYGATNKKHYVGNLLSDIEFQPKQIVEAFGPVELVQVPTDPETRHCRGFGFIQFDQLEQAKGAQSLNGKLEIAGWTIEVSFVGGHVGVQDSGTKSADFDDDDDDDGGLDLKAQSRSMLMAKLDSNGTGIPRPRPPPKPPPWLISAQVVETLISRSLGSIYLSLEDKAVIRGKHVTMLVGGDVVFEKVGLT